MYDAIVLGGGLYGCKMALALRSSGVRRVLLVEPNTMLGGATTVNQNRVHGGYHYPRSLKTARSAQANYVRFLADHAPAIVRNDRHVYAIAEGSKTSPEEFRAAMDAVGAPLKAIAVPHWMTDDVLAAYEVEEVVFDIVKLREFVAAQFRQTGVEVRQTYGYIKDVDDRCATVAVMGEHHHFEMEEARYVFNCTYGSLADVGARVKTRLQYEWCEVALVDAPLALARTDVTVMNGLFWSLMWYPSKGCHALTHVEHTVHRRWFSDGNTGHLTHYETAFPAMRDAAAEHAPVMRECKHLGSLWTRRVVLADNEPDDGRPILWEYDERSPRVISVLGSKFNSVYDAVEMVERGEWRQNDHALNVRTEGRRALVGMGFVGRNLDVPGRFTDRYNRRNINDLAGHYRQLVIAAPGAQKWLANADPDADLDGVVDLVAALRRCTADEVRLVSTIDVHSDCSYGENRKYFEEKVREVFPHAKVVRLPALYGPGLKKNALFDLLHRGEAYVHPDSTYQWFDVRGTWAQFEGLKPGWSWDVLPASLPLSWLCEQVGAPANPHGVISFYQRGPYNIPLEDVKAGLLAYIEEVRCAKSPS